MPPRAEAGPDAARRSAVAKMFAHDLRNPISALAANVSYLQAELTDLGDDLRGALDDCAFSVGVLRHLVDNYVQIARLEAGERGAAVPVPLRQVVDAALQAGREITAAAEVEIRLEGAVPDAIYALDVPLVTMVLKNLLAAAAAQAVGAEGGVALRVAADAEGVRFAVADAGPLVDAEHREALLTLDLQLRAKALPGARYARGFGLYAAGLGAAALGGSATAGARDGRFEIAVAIPCPRLE